ncbi:MAG: hypothetical protein IT578_02115 [Verrucomicrobiae bacterium]|nr:hypothetical protein [Verrucomicrobiae bacterium]
METVSPLRIGAVPFLNARPHLHGLEEEAVYELPARLAERLRAGELDVALAPVAAFLGEPRFGLLDGIAIACRGEVRSVYLAHRGPLADARTVAFEADSRSSSLLLRLALDAFLGLEGKWTPAADARAADARLWFGDSALRARARFLADGWRLLDLGELWHRQTGLPFVFAGWIVAPGADPTRFAKRLHVALASGIAARDTIAERQDVTPPEEARDYLRRCVRYELGPDEKRGLEEFRSLCAKRGFIPDSPGPTIVG